MTVRNYFEILEKNVYRVLFDYRQSLRNDSFVISLNIIKKVSIFKLKWFNGFLVDKIPTKLSDWYPGNFQKLTILGKYPSFWCGKKSTQHSDSYLGNRFFGECLKKISTNQGYKEENFHNSPIRVNYLQTYLVYDTRHQN